MPKALFIVVRHGNTFEVGEPVLRIGARTDLPLTAVGIAQCDALGAHFATLRLHFDRVLVSSLMRTRQTATAILDHLPDTPEPVSCTWLREIDHGPDEGATEDAVLARIGSDSLRAWDTLGTPPPGWTVEADTRLAAWRDLFARANGSTLLITSNGAGRFALMAAGLAPPEGLKLSTGSYGVIRKSADDTLELLKWGCRP